MSKVTASHLDWLLNVDEALPFTQDNKSFSDDKNHFLDYYKSIRHKVTYPDVVPQCQETQTPRFIGDALSALAKTSLRNANLTSADFAKLIPDDGYSAALEVMATVSAFYRGMPYIS